MNEKKHRETSKILLWTIIALSSVFSTVALILAYLSGELAVTVPVVGGIWSVAVPVAIGFYSDKAKAENEIKLQMLMQAPSEELLQVQQQLTVAQDANKKLKSERDAAKREVSQLKQRLTPLEEIIRNASPGTA